MADAAIVYRSIEKKDVSALHAMMRALAAHEGSEAHLMVTPSRLEEAGFDGEAQWRGFLAEASGRAIGYATYTEGFHLWSGARRILLDDIYVDPDHRGAGVGERLMKLVFSIAGEDAFVSWTVLPDNDRAIAFYKRLGAEVSLTGKCNWRKGGL